jgi:glutathione S-transferase
MGSLSSDRASEEETGIVYYFAPGSSSFAAHVALEEIGTNYQARPVRLAQGEQRNDSFLTINPQGRVPVLIAEGQIITETIAILTYLANRFPDKALLPLDEPSALARTYELMSWFATTIHVAIAEIWRTERFTDREDVKPALIAFGRQVVSSSYRRLEQIVSESCGPWLCGERYTVVDPYAFVLWRWGQRLEMDPSLFPAWAEHCERLMLRPAVVRVLQHEGS